MSCKSGGEGDCFLSEEKEDGKGDLSPHLADVDAPEDVDEDFVGDVTSRGRCPGGGDEGGEMNRAGGD